MNVQIFTPSSPLLPYIEAYYFTWPDTPSHRPTAHFPAGSHSYVKFSPSSGILSGQTTLPAEIALDWGDEGFGVELRVGAIYALFGIPAHEITNCVVDLEDILGGAAHELAERLASSSTPAEKIRHVEEIFARLASKRGEESFSTELAAITALASGQSSSVSHLAGRLGYSPRQLQRKLNDFVGLSPRLFKRISRFEKARRLIQTLALREGLSWSDIAFLCGYSDQSHLIRDFREFAGFTPAAFVSAADLSDSFNTHEVSSPIIVLS